MTRQVSLRQISGPLLLAAVFLQLTIDLHVPGAALAIVRRGEVIFARGFGVADVENKTPVTPRTAFFIGSTTARARYRSCGWRLPPTARPCRPSTKVMKLRGIQQTRLGHPAVLFGDWRRSYTAVRVVRAGELDGRKIYVIPLESDGLAPTMVSVGAETGDVLQDQRTLVFPGVGNVPTTTYADYRLLSGRRVPYRYVESTEMSGRTIYQVERVEVGVELNPSTFTLQP